MFMNGRLVTWDGTRKPDRDTFTYVKVLLDGEVACFDTKPFRDVAEYLKYRDVASKFERLVTRQEWDEFYRLLDKQE